MHSIFLYAHIVMLCEVAGGLTVDRPGSYTSLLNFIKVNYTLKKQNLKDRPIYNFFILWILPIKL